MLDMGQADYEEANLESESTFYEPNPETSVPKSTGGGMSTIKGHINYIFRKLYRRLGCGVMTVNDSGVFRISKLN